MATLTGIPFTPITTMRGDVAAPAVIRAGLLQTVASR